MCQDLPCACTLYIYAELYTFNSITLKKVDSPNNVHMLSRFSSSSFLTINPASVAIAIEGKTYEVSYKRVIAEGTTRNYAHLNR